MSGFFNITVVSLPEYEELVAEIYINGRFVALLSQEKGPTETQIEFEKMGGQNPNPLKLSLKVFEEAVTEAKRQLFLLSKTPNTGQ